jgi:hypothetical protein
MDGCERRKTEPWVTEKHLVQKFWTVHKIYVQRQTTIPEYRRAHRTIDGCQTPIPVLLERQHNLSVAENESSRISGMHEKSLSDANHRFQDFWNVQKILCA